MSERFNTAEGFTVGDYVIVTHPAEGTDPTFKTDTFMISYFTRNLLGQTVAGCTDITRQGDTPTLFYPRELSWEDGSRPVRDSLGYSADFPGGVHVSRGAW